MSEENNDSNPGCAVAALGFVVAIIVIILSKEIGQLKMRVDSLEQKAGIPKEKGG